MRRTQRDERMNTTLIADLLSIPAIAVLTLIVLGGCTSPKYMSKSVDTSEIRSAKREIDSDDSVVPRYVDDIKAEKLIYQIYRELLPSAKRVCRTMGEDNCTWDVRYSTDESFNAFASNASTVTIQKGVLKYARNDDEVALVIAHELSHHAANHIEETIKNAQTGGLLGMFVMGVASAYANQSNPYGQINVQRDMETGAQLGALLGKLKYSKDQENEADYLAAIILHGSGFDLENGKGVFSIMSSTGNGPHGNLKNFSTHPSPAERLARWQATIREMDLTGGQLLSKQDRETLLGEGLASKSRSTDNRSVDSVDANVISLSKATHKQRDSHRINLLSSPSNSRGSDSERYSSLNLALNSRNSKDKIETMWRFAAGKAASIDGCVGSQIKHPKLELVFKEKKHEKYQAYCSDGSERQISCDFGFPCAIAKETRESLIN